ncbi:FeoB-associated Cys-rich membrane protein [Marinifilum sp.]|uniref:FeoB-associated Cys-rich membrane protein n=1 Tax=Marinifilum sp. TaxID=2033137 RepID=UPI003BAC0276
MNLQLILTYLIILYAVAYTCYQFVRLIRKQKKSACGGGSCSGCDFKKELNKKGIQFAKDTNLTYLKN